MSLLHPRNSSAATLLKTCRYSWRKIARERSCWNEERTFVQERFVSFFRFFKLLCLRYRADPLLHLLCFFSRGMSSPWVVNRTAVLPLRGRARRGIEFRRRRRSRKRLSDHLLRRGIFKYTDRGDHPLWLVRKLKDRPRSAWSTSGAEAKVSKKGGGGRRVQELTFLFFDLLWVPQERARRSAK